MRRLKLSCSPVAYNHLRCFIALKDASSQDLKTLRKAQRMAHVVYRSVHFEEIEMPGLYLTSKLVFLRSHFARYSKITRLELFYGKP